MTDKNIYIKKYYLKLLELFFNYVDYDELVDAYNDLENLYIENADLEELKNSLIGKIQEKNVIEAQMEDL